MRAASPELLWCHRVSINAAKPIAGISVINDQQASVYASLKVRKPAQDNQMTLL
jgi:hypothetical protein